METAEKNDFESMNEALFVPKPSDAFVIPRVHIMGVYDNLESAQPLDWTLWKIELDTLEKRRFLAFSDIPSTKTPRLCLKGLLGKNYYQSITKPIRSRGSPHGDWFYNG